MSEKGDHSKTSREERLAAQLRANLRRRKQASRKVKTTTSDAGHRDGQNPAKPSP